MTIETVQVNFQVGAITEVTRALQSVEKAMARLDGVTMRSSRVAQREQSKQATVQEKAGRDAVKLAEKIARDTEKATEKSEREKTRITERWAKQRERIVTNSAIANAKAIIKESEAEQRARSRMNSALGRNISRGAGGVLGAGAKIAGTVMGLGGGFAISSAIGTEIQNKGKAKEIAIQSGGALTSDQVYSTASNAGTTYGKGTDEVLGGLDAFIAKSGDAKMATDTMGEILKLSNATGASFEDLGRVAGQIFASDKTQSAEQLVQLMRDLGAQGRAASVDMKELAEYAARISGGAQEFGGNKGATMRTLGGLAQLAAAKGGAATAAEATESVLSLGRDINEHADKFATHGIKTNDANGMLLAPEAIIRSAVTSTGGNKEEIMGMFGQRSYRAVAGYANTYLEAKGEAKSKGMKGAAVEEYAVKKADAAVSEFSKATFTAAQMTKENADRMGEADKQLASALNDLRTAVGVELVPEIRKAIPLVRELVPQFASMLHGAVALAQFFANNPLLGIGGVMAAAITKEMASAALGSALQKAIATQTGASFATGIGIASAAITVAEAGMIAIAKIAADDQRDDKSVADRGREALTLSGQLRADAEAGKSDPKKQERAKALMESLKADTEQGPSGFKVLGGVLSSALGQSEGPEKMKTEHYRAAQNTKDALDLLTAAFQKASGQLAAAAPPNAAPPNASIDPARYEPMSSRRGGASK